MSKAPLLILALKRSSTSTRYKALVWILTFCVYASYHLSRRPITIVKNALHKKCVGDAFSVNKTEMVNISTHPCRNDDSWAPFDDHHPYEDYFGALDSTYLAAYAVGMFISGHVAERMNLRYFLASGMTLSAIMTAAFGFGYLWKIHNLAYYIIVQILCGLVQSTGWPGVVACMGNWFGKGRRGFIMGIWNAHTSLGNILGGLIAAAFLTKFWEDNGYWFWSFLYPAAIILFFAVLVFFLLVPHPEDVGLPDANQTTTSATSSFDPSLESSPLINDETSDEEFSAGAGTGLINNDQTPHDQARAVSLIGALRVPGVVEFSFCLFFTKLVSYTFLYWLPQYIKQEMSAHVHMTDPDSTAGDLATIVDVGGIFGAIVAGFMADYTGSSALTCAVLLVLSIPTMVVYREFGSLSYPNAVGLLLLTGFITNGPYCLITTSVSADLGTHPSLSRNAKALATVTAIIDGTGSIGAALGPGLTAIIDGLSKPQEYKMNVVFAMLIGSNIFALLFLSRLIYKEVRVCLNRRKRSRTS